MVLFSVVLLQVSDNSGASIHPIQTKGNPSGSAFSEGRHVIEYEARDAAGNSASCSFAVTVTGTSSNNSVIT